MNFDLPEELVAYLAELDDFIEREIKPLEAQDDNIRFFDHRREHARTDWDRGGLPRHDWEALLAEARRRADAAGHYRYAFPKEFGGRDGTTLGMAVVCDHPPAHGPRAGPGPQKPAKRRLVRRDPQAGPAGPLDPPVLRLNPPLRHLVAEGRILDAVLEEEGIPEGRQPVR